MDISRLVEVRILPLRPYISDDKDKASAPELENTKGVGPIWNWAGSRNTRKAMDKPLDVKNPAHQGYL